MRGIIVVHTPGHTPGHISLYLKRERILVAGDALFQSEGALVPCPDSSCCEPALAKWSLKKLTGYEIEAAICYHGGVYRDGVSRGIAELAGGDS